MRNLILTTAAVAAAIAGAFAGEPSFGTLTDGRDGQKYKTVKIGTQTWMAQNLNYEPQAGKFWCYKNSDDSCKKYGRLYDWTTAATVCPKGWKLPSREDWDSLEQAVGGKRTSGEDGNIGWLGAGKKLKSKSGWRWSELYSASGNGTDDFGFSALPGGRRYYADGTFATAGYYGYWWTSTEIDRGRAYRRGMYNDFDDEYESDFYKRYGLSVRCVEDSAGSTIMRKHILTTGAVAAEPSFGTLTDTRDGQTYKTVKIGKQTWMAQNINYQTKGGSWCYKNKADNCKKYGRLYDWKTAKTVCPKGWKLPSREDWDYLGQAVGGEKEPDDKGMIYWYGAGEKLKSKSGWNKNGKGTNDFGFSALPGGGRHDINGNFYYADDYGIWWTATEYDSDNAYGRSMGYYSDNVGENDGNKSSGFSVRCVADNP